MIHAMIEKMETEKLETDGNFKSVIPAQAGIQ
jgi:hypothetical protein